MTSNQIKYWDWKEKMRSNQANETETARSNQAREQIDISKLNETVRSNKASEAENHRANVAKEGENRRANVARETIDISKLNETHRANVKKEAQEDTKILDAWAKFEAEYDLDLLKQEEVERMNQAQILKMMADIDKMAADIDANTDRNIVSLITGALNSIGRVIPKLF